MKSRWPRQSYNRKRMRLLLALLLSFTAMNAGDLSNRRAPSFSLMDQNQKERDIQDYRGKVLLIEWMQTSCPHCGTFTSILEEAKAKYPGKVEVLSIVLPPDSIENVRKFAKEHKSTMPFLFDSGQMTASYLKITPQNPNVVFPQVFLIDQNGMIKQNFKYSNETESIFSGKALFLELDKLVK
jgi:peroxiredoxin